MLDGKYYEVNFTLIPLLYTLKGAIITIGSGYIYIYLFLNIKHMVVWSQI